jgi:hypothetical protein
MKTGKTGPMMTVGMPSKTNPANSKASRPLRLPVWAGDARVVNMDENHSEGAGLRRQLHLILTKDRFPSMQQANALLHIVEAGVSQSP